MGERERGDVRALRCSLQSPCCLPLSQGEEWGRGRGGTLGPYAVVCSLPAVCLCPRVRSGVEGEGAIGPYAVENIEKNRNYIEKIYVFENKS